MTKDSLIITLKAYENLKPGDVVRFYYKKAKKITKKEHQKFAIGVVVPFYNTFPIKKDDNVNISILGYTNINQEMEDILCP